MADFPSLEPLTRTWSMGAFLMTTQDYSSGSIRFLQGSTAADLTLELAYSELLPSEAALIRSHYQGQQGGFLPFDLSAASMAGHTSSPFPVTAQWRYATPPEEIQRNVGKVDVVVRLISVLV